MTRILDGIVKKGVVLRETDPLDRRVINVTLTEKGTAVVQRVTADFIGIHERIIDSIEPGTRAAVVRALEDLLRALNNGLVSA